MKHLFIYILLLFLHGCKFKMPDPLTTKSCISSNYITYTIDASNYKKYSFILSDPTVVNSQVTWQSSNGVILGTSTNGGYSYTFPNDGNFNINATYQNLCGENITLVSNVIAVNIDQLSERKFSLTDPIVSESTKFVVTNDGTVIASDNDLIKVWDYSTQTLLKSFRHPNLIFSSLESLILSSDEKYIYTTNGKNIIQWDWKTGVAKSNINYSSSSGWIGDLSISGNGNFLIFRDGVGDGQRKIIIYDILNNTYKEYNISGSPSRLKLSNDGSQFSYSDINKSFHTVKNTNSGNELWSISTIGQAMYLNPDLKFGISSNGAQNNTVTFRVWDISLNRNIYDIFIPFKSLLGSNLGFVTFSSDGKSVIFNAETIFDLENKKVLWTRNGLEQNPFNGTFSQNKRYLGATNYGSIQLIDLLTGKNKPSIFFKNAYLINSATFSPDNKYVCTSDFSSLKFWDVISGNIINSIPFFKEIPYYSLLPKKEFIWILKDRDIWKINSKTFESKQITFSKSTNYLLVSKDEKYYGSVNSDNTFRVFDGSNNIQLSQIQETSYGNATFSSDNKYLVTTFEDIRNSQYSLKIYNTNNGSLLKKINNISSQSPNALSISNLTANLVAHSIPSQLKIININDEKIVNIFNTPSFIIDSVFSPDDKNIAGRSTDKKIFIYNLEKNALLFEKTFPNHILNIEYNDNGTQIFVTTSKEFYVIAIPK